MARDCTNCMFFQPGDDPSDEFPGECRRNPPVQHTQDSQYSFVRVNAAAWCGEYEYDGSNEQ